jgi:hypothetical protein
MNNLNDYRGNKLHISYNNDNRPFIRYNNAFHQLTINQQEEYTLKLITPLTPVGPHIFTSLGILNPNVGSAKDTLYFDGQDFPIDTKYQLMGGKFPLTDYKDLFQNSNKYHTLYEVENGIVKNEGIKVKLLGFNGDSCKEESIHRYSPCQITVKKVIEKPTVGGRKKSILKKKSNRKKSNRKKSNRRR